MNIVELIEDIYSHASRPKPKEIIFFHSVEEAFLNYKNWSCRVEKVMTCLWWYQFPMANPSSYWASYHLKKDNYRLDVKRRPNTYGCFVHGEHLNQESALTLTENQYASACSDLINQKFDLTVNLTLNKILESYKAEMEHFSECLFMEDGTCQAGIEDFIFLGSFDWLQKELWLLNYFKNKYGVKVNEPMLQTLEGIKDSGKLFFTFSNLVIVTDITQARPSPAKNGLLKNSQ